MAQNLKFFKVSGALPTSPQANSIYFVKDGPNVDQFITDSSGVAFPVYVRPIVESETSSIFIHNDAANTRTDVWTPNITFKHSGNYLMTLSFNWNANATNNNSRFYASFNGNALDQNNQSGDAQGVELIFQGRVDNAGNTSATAITGTGSGHKLDYSSVFEVTVNDVSSPIPFIFGIGGQNDTSSVSAWNITLKFELISLL